MPEIKADRDEVINTYYECKRRREASGKSMYGINTEVAELVGSITRQRVGQIIKEYEADLPAADQVIQTESKPKATESKTESIPAGPGKWEVAAPKAREKLTGSLGHQEQEDHSGEKSPQRMGETSPSGLNDNQSIKQVQDMIRSLQASVDSGLKALGRDVLAVEGKLGKVKELAGENAHQITLANERAAERLEILEEAAQPKKRTKPLKTQTAIVEALTGGRLRTTNQLAAELELSPSAIRNAMVHLKEKDLIVVEKESQRSGDRVVNVNLVHLKQH